MTTPSKPGARLADHLDHKLKRHLARIEESEAYRLVADPESDSELVLAFVRHALLEVFSYGPHVTEATFTAIGRFPKDRPDLMWPLIKHDLVEVNHGEMALKDFVRLGGDAAWARERRMTPASYAMAATCKLIGENENPFAYLGYMYPFEALTPTLMERAVRFLAQHGFPVHARKFIDLHAEADIEHADELRSMIVQIVDDYPGAAEAIEHAFDCFAAVYPIPVWGAALCRAKRERDRGAKRIAESGVLPQTQSAGALS